MKSGYIQRSRVHWLAAAITAVMILPLAGRAKTAEPDVQLNMVLWKSGPKLIINKDLAHKYKKLLLDLKHSLKLEDEINFDIVVFLPHQQ